MSFELVGPADGVPKGTAIQVEVGDTEVAVVHADDDNFYAVRDECSHAAVPLSEGEVDGCTLECWLHGSRFDLRSGEPATLPAFEPVAVYPVQIDGDDLLVDLENPINNPAA
jgi:3-phenylpropionate/trans-cinnamate dioxygenase ferredoxin subunit